MVTEEKKTQALDVDEFIRRTTYEIWDKKLVGKIYDYYTEDAVIHAGEGKKIIGAEAIVADTLEWQAAFPDIKIKILDVIWCGDEREGYRASMPWVTIGTNTGYSKFGPPTGKRLHEGNNLGIANTLIKKVDGQWKYVEEWSMYDLAAMQKVCSTKDLETQEEEQA